MNSFKTLFCIGLVFCFSTLSLAEPSTLKAKKNQVRISVMGQEDFHPDRAVPGNIKSLPDDLAARLIEHLTATKRFEVLERTALRRVIREQQFGRDQSATDLDKVIEKTVDNLPSMNGWTIATAGAVADYNDLLKEFRDLGTTVGADYIVYAVLEKHQGSQTSQAVPYTDRVQTTNQVEARLRLRVIETSQGRIVGSDSLHTRISENVFDGRASKMDAYSMFDHLGSEAAISVLDMIFPPTVVAEDPWVINRGSNEHVKTGDRYTLIREGKEIKDAAGVVIGRIRSEVGVAEVSQVQSTLSVLSLLEGDLKVDDLGQRVTRATVVTPARSGGDATAIGSQALTLMVGKVKISPHATTILHQQEHTARMTNDLMVKLSQFAEFDVMERAEMEQILDEKTFISITSGTPVEGALQEIQGADYLVHSVIDDFRVRVEKKEIPYTDEIQTRYYGTVEATSRLIDVHTSKLASAIKIRLNDRLKNVTSESMAVSDLVDRLSTEMATRISDDLLARQKGELVPDGRVEVAPPKAEPEPEVNHPNF